MIQHTHTTCLLDTHDDAVLYNMVPHVYWCTVLYGDTTSKHTVQLTAD